MGVPSVDGMLTLTLISDEGPPGTGSHGTPLNELNLPGCHLSFSSEYSGFHTEEFHREETESLDRNFPIFMKTTKMTKHGQTWPK